MTDQTIFLQEDAITNNLKFKDISSELWRKYTFANGATVLIQLPSELNVSASGGHRILDLEGTSHYIPSGWIHLEWKSAPDKPAFVF